MKTHKPKKNASADSQSRSRPFRSGGLQRPSLPHEPELASFRFVALFAGVGGFRLALQRLGGRCVFSCEWDTYARQTYQANFGESPTASDIRCVDLSTIPPHDILTAGFPCQPFSIAGVSKKRSLGRPEGFADEHQGN